MVNAEEEVEAVAHAHEIFALGVTLLAIAISLSGISVVVERRVLWGIGLVFGGIGAGFVLLGITDWVA